MGRSNERSVTLRAESPWKWRDYAAVGSLRFACGGSQVCFSVLATPGPYVAAQIPHPRSRSCVLDHRRPTVPGIEHREKAMNWCLVVDGHQYACGLLVRLGRECCFAQPLYSIGVTVVEETTGFGVQRSDRCHIFRAQIEIEDGEVFHDSFLMD
jgi:hypothetical protein